MKWVRVDERVPRVDQQVITLELDTRGWYSPALNRYLGRHKWWRDAYPVRYWASIPGERSRVWAPISDKPNLDQGYVMLLVHTADGFRGWDSLDGDPQEWADFLASSNRPDRWMDLTRYSTRVDPDHPLG